MELKKIRQQFTPRVIMPLVMSFPSYWLRHKFLKHMGMKIGKGSSVLRFCNFLVPSRIIVGTNSIINQHCFLDGRGSRVIIGDNVDIAQETNIWTLQHEPNSAEHATTGGDVIIEDHVWIASRVTILPGVKIGKGAVVACCSVVTKDVPEMSIVAGVPARVIGRRRNDLTYNLNYQPLFM